MLSQTGDISPACQHSRTWKAFIGCAPCSTYCGKGRFLLQIVKQHWLCEWAGRNTTWASWGPLILLCQHRASFYFMEAGAVSTVRVSFTSWQIHIWRGRVFPFHTAESPRRGRADPELLPLGRVLIPWPLVIDEAGFYKTALYPREKGHGCVCVGGLGVDREAWVF